MEDNLNGLSYKELNKLVSKLKSKYPKLGRFILDNSLERNLERMIRDGWKIRFADWFWKKTSQEITGKISGLYQIFPNAEKIIDIRPRLLPYQRDLALFHELSHLHYEDYSFYLGRGDYPFSVGDEEFDENEIFIEWSARRFRANPRLLKIVIETFGLEPKIYDFSSYRAFGNGNQVQEEYFRRIGVLID